MEQRFLGEILVRRGGRARSSGSRRCTRVQREKGIDLVELLVNGNVARRGDDRAGARRRVRSCPSSSDIDVEAHRDGARDAPPDQLREAAQGRSSSSEDDGSVYVRRRRPVRHDGARRRARAVRQAGRGDASRRASAIEDAINRVYERDDGGGELETDEDAASDDDAGRHPRLGRRRARSSAGSTALFSRR